jgi:hypothetical protein
VNAAGVPAAADIPAADDVPDADDGCAAAGAGAAADGTGALPAGEAASTTHAAVSTAPPAPITRDGRNTIESPDAARHNRRADLLFSARTVTPGGVRG